MPGGEPVEQRSGASRLGQQRTVYREAAIGGAVFLENDPGIAAIEQVQFDAIGDQVVERVRRGEPHAQPDNSIRIARGDRAGRTAQIVLSGGDEQRYRSRTRLNSCHSFSSRFPSSSFFLNLSFL